MARGKLKKRKGGERVGVLARRRRGNVSYESVASNEGKFLTTAGAML